MKVQYFGNRCFTVSGADASVVFEPDQAENLGEHTIGFTSTGAAQTAKVKRMITLPGEYEISDILVKGFYSNPENIVYRTQIDDLSVVNFGDLRDKPKKELMDQIGENIDVAIISLNEQFDHKKAKEMIDNVAPKMVIVGGDQTQFPKFIENTGTKIAEENPMQVKKSSFSDDKIHTLILPL